MSDQMFAIEVDNAALLKALDEVGVLADQYLLDAAVETGRAVATEAEARLRRQTNGTGKTAGNITVTSALPSWLGGGPGSRGSVYVYVRPSGRPDNLSLWLEYGTLHHGQVHTDPRPFLQPAAQIEAGPHRRRIAEALERAIHDAGFSESEAA